MMAQVKSELIEKDTKSHQSRRISLDAATLDLLRQRREEQLELSRQTRIDLLPDAFVFTDSVSGSESWLPDRVTQAFSRLCAANGIKGVRLHDLRHFAATHMLTSGVDVRTVSGRLGHADASTTLGVYSQFMESADSAAADVLGNRSVERLLRSSLFDRSAVPPGRQAAGGSSQVHAVGGETPAIAGQVCVLVQQFDETLRSRAAGRSVSKQMTTLRWGGPGR